MNKKLKKYIDYYMKQKEQSFFGSMLNLKASKKECTGSVSIDNSLCDKEINVHNFINNNKNENYFQKLLFKYIDDKNLKDSDVYNKVHID